MLQQFLGTVRMQVKQMLAYKFEVLLWTLTNPVIFAIEYFFWSAIYNFYGQATIRGYTFPDMLWYIIISMTVFIFTFTNLDMELARRINDGRLALNLIQPLTYFRERLGIRFGTLLMSSLLQAVPLIAIAGLLFGLRLPTALNALFFAASVLFAFFINFTIVFIFGNIAFWTKTYGGIRVLREATMFLLSGAAIPLILLPHELQKILSYLPFQYVAFVPTQIYLGKYVPAQLINIILIQILWCAVLYAISKIIWHFGVKRFTGAGA